MAKSKSVPNRPRWIWIVIDEKTALRDFFGSLYRSGHGSGFRSYRAAKRACDKKKAECDAQAQRMQGSESAARWEERRDVIHVRRIALPANFWGGR